MYQLIIIYQWLQVADTFQLRVQRTPGLLVHVIEARRRLAGQLTSDLLSMPHNDLLEGAIVLEEFIKVRHDLQSLVAVIPYAVQELCSIIYAKTSWNILALPPLHDCRLRSS